MPFTAAVHHGRPHLLVKASGPATLTDLMGLADMAATIASMAGYRRTVFDMLGAELSSLSFTEHLSLGAHVAERFRLQEKVATVVTPESRKGTSEKAAQKLGLRLRTFTDLDEAFAWVSADA
jgi:hypothetical protein